MRRGRENKYLPCYEKQHDSAGIYVISMPEVSKLIYIGSAAQTIRRRWRQHICDLLANRHGNRLLQRAANKYGLDKLQFEIVEICSPNEALKREQAWIDKHEWNDLFNLNPNSSSRLGAKLTKADRLKLAEKHGGISSPKVLRQIAKEYRAGASHGEIAKKHNVDRSSVRNYLVRLGVKMRPFASANPRLVAKLKTLYAKGFPSSYCAEQVNIDQGTALRILKREGVLRNVEAVARLTAAKRGRRSFAEAAGAHIHSFSHPLHGKFRGFQFQLRDAFGLNETLLSQLCRGLIKELSGWTLDSRPKKPRLKTRSGKSYHFVHSIHGDFVGRQRALLSAYDGLQQACVSALVRGKLVSHRGWEIKMAKGKHVFRGGSTNTRSGKPRNYRRKIPLALHAQIKRQAAKGMSQVSLAEKYDVSAKCISKICRKGLPPAGRTIIPKEQYARIKAALISGATQASIAKKYGVHQASISNLIKRQDWKIK
jgi:group I intron endonuclease